MVSPTPPQQPISIRPAAPVRWLGSAVRFCVRHASQLPGEGAVLAVSACDVLALRAIYQVGFPEHQGIICQPAEHAADDVANTNRLQAGLDVVIPIASDEKQALADLNAALLLARSARCSVYALGISVGAALRAGLQAMPLPWARMVVVIEAPFYVPEHPALIPAAWPAAIRHLMQRASGQARDILATWKHSGQPPAT